MDLVSAHVDYVKSLALSLRDEYIYVNTCTINVENFFSITSNSNSHLTFVSAPQTFFSFNQIRTVDM